MLNSVYYAQPLTSDVFDDITVTWKYSEYPLHAGYFPLIPGGTETHKTLMKLVDLSFIVGKSCLKKKNQTQ
jgi:hypothetical protein